MNRLLTFLKTTVLGGFFVLLPILLFYLLLGEAFALIVALATPITNLFPNGILENGHVPAVLALLLILLLSLALGLAAKSKLAARVGRWVEHHTLARAPLYGALKGLAAGLGEIGEGIAFRPALLVSVDGQREFAYIVEDHSDGQVTIMLPRAPTPLSGSVKIVRREQVELLDAKFADVTRVLSQWGVGARDLLKGGRSKVTTLRMSGSVETNPVCPSLLLALAGWASYLLGSVQDGDYQHGGERRLLGVL